MLKNDVKVIFESLYPRMGARFYRTLALFSTMRSASRWRVVSSVPRTQDPALKKFEIRSAGVLQTPAPKIQKNPTDLSKQNMHVPLTDLVEMCTSGIPNTQEGSKGGDVSRVRPCRQAWQHFDVHQDPSPANFFGRISIAFKSRKDCQQHFPMGVGSVSEE